MWPARRAAFTAFRCRSALWCRYGFFQQLRHQGRPKEVLGNGDGDLSLKMTGELGRPIDLSDFVPSITRVADSIYDGDVAPSSPSTPGSTKHRHSLRRSGPSTSCTRHFSNSLGPSPSISVANERLSFLSRNLRASLLHPCANDPMARPRQIGTNLCPWCTRLPPKWRLRHHHSY